MSVSSTGTSSGRRSGAGADSASNGHDPHVDVGVGRGEVAPAAGDAGRLELDQVTAVEAGVRPADEAVGDRGGDARS